MKIAMIGTGYVGLVSGVCFSDFGHEVVCVDKDPRKVEMLNRGEVPIYEPGLDLLMAKNVEAGRLSFTGDLAAAVAGAEAVFIAVGTPTRRGDGHADLSYVYAAAEEIANAIAGYTVVVTKSTVPVGTNRRVGEIIGKTNPEAEFDVASNPEFLREGAAIDDFMRPDRVVVGVETDRAAEVMNNVYRPLYLRDFPVVTTDIESAEMIKYAANAFLAAKITFINEIAMLCEKVGADVKQVSKGMGLDGRIGNKFLHAGPGYGGSCFPKDTSALARIGQEHGVPMRITETVMAVNDTVKRRMIDKILDLCGGSVNGKTVAVLGVTFKPNTDDMRDAPSLTIVPALVGGGAQVRVVDPQGRREGEHLLPGVEWSDDPYAAAEKADIVVVLTEWNEFRALDLGRLAERDDDPAHGRPAQRLRAGRRPRGRLRLRRRGPRRRHLSPRAAGDGVGVDVGVGAVGEVEEDRDVAELLGVLEADVEEPLRRLAGEEVPRRRRMGPVGGLVEIVAPLEREPLPVLALERAAGRGQERLEIVLPAVDGGVQVGVARRTAAGMGRERAEPLVLVARQENELRLREARRQHLVETRAPPGIVLEDLPGAEIGRREDALVIALHPGAGPFVGDRDVEPPPREAQLMLAEIAEGGRAAALHPDAEDLALAGGLQPGMEARRPAPAPEGPAEPPSHDAFRPRRQVHRSSPLVFAAPVPPPAAHCQSFRHPARAMARSNSPDPRP